MTLVAMGYLLFTPIAPLHQRGSDAKVRALADLQLHVDEVRTQGFAASDPVRTSQLANLPARRSEMTRVREWPFAINVQARLGRYLAIVPLTGVGAALIEMLVAALLA